MSFAEILPEVRTLSRREKFQLAQMLLEDLARDESPLTFKEGQAYPIYTPAYSPTAATQLGQDEIPGMRNGVVEKCWPKP
jgi:hypothetical protein